MTTYRAKRLPKQPGPAGWNEILGDQAPAVTLEANTTADVAIIGAGFAGLSAARRLYQLDPSLRVIVMDAGRIAHGPAGRNSGFMIDLPHNLSSESYAGEAIENDIAQTRLNRHAIGFAAEAAADYGVSIDTFDPCGKINAAATAAGDHHNHAYANHLKACNEPFRLLDAAQMADLTGTDYYTSGLFTPGTVMIQPAAYIRALYAGLKPGLRAYENTPVQAITRKGDTWALTTPKAIVTASRVILANNGHAESFGFFERRLMHVFTYASMTEPLAPNALGGAPKWGVTPADPMGTTVRRFHGAGDRIVIRSRFTYNPTMEVSDTAVARAGALHDRKFNERFPMLRGTKMAYRWAGHLCLSYNDVPAHGEIEPGLFAAVCQNGLGTVKGTLAGLSAAELALSQSSEITRAMTCAPPPKRLPPEPFATIGARATLKWKERRAGRE